MRRLVSALCIIALAALPARADFGAGNNLVGFWGASKVLGPQALDRATCQYSGSNLTTYTFSGVSTGAASTASGMVVFGILAEDSASVYTVSTATADSNSMHVVADQGASTTVDAAIWATDSTTLTGLDSVDVSVTFSEAITSAVVCVWVIENARSSTADSNNKAANGSGTVNTLTLNPTVSGGFAVGVCNFALTGGSSAFTWAVLTEREDTDAGGADEQHYTNADASATGSSMSVTCDTGGSGSTSGAAAAFH